MEWRPIALQNIRVNQSFRSVVLNLWYAYHWWFTRLFQLASQIKKINVRKAILCSFRCHVVRQIEKNITGEHQRHRSRTPTFCCTGFSETVIFLFYLLESHIFWWIKIVQKNSLANLFHHSFVWSEIEAKVRYLSSDLRFLFLLMILMTLMTMRMLTEMTRTTGTAKIQMLSPVSIQQLKWFWKRIFFINVTFVLTSGSRTQLVREYG